MNIVYILWVFPKLSETFIQNHITGLISRGHNVRVLAFTRPSENQVHEDFLKYELGQKVHYLRYRGDQTLLDPLNIRELLSCLNADLIHVHFATEAATVAQQIKKSIGIPYIVTVHAHDIFVQADPEELRSKFDQAEKVLTVSQFNLRYLVELLGPQYQEKISIQNYGVDLEKFRCVERQPGDPVTILFAGRLVEKKSPLDVIDAFWNVLKRNPESRLVMVGEGPLKESVLRKIRDHGIQESVDMIGDVTQKEMICRMSEAHMFFLPSRTDQDGEKEGMPLVILEAQAMGLPVVSTIHSGIPEAITDGETGFLVPEGDCPAMSEKICALIESPELRLKMGKAGRARAEERFDLNRELDQLEETMQEIVRKQNVSLEHRIQRFFPTAMEHFETKIRPQEDRTIMIKRLVRWVDYLPRNLIYRSARYLYWKGARCLGLLSPTRDKDCRK